MFSFYHHRVDCGPFYFVIDFSVLSFGIWFFVDPDQSVSVECNFLIWSIGVNLLRPTEEEVS